MKSVNIYKNNELIKEFTSIKDVALFFKLDESTIRYYLKHNKQYKGFTISENNKINNDLKILLIDIETSPILTYTFKTRKTYIENDFILRDWSILSYAAKWLTDDKIYSDTVFKYVKDDLNDYNLCKDIHELLDEANIIIAHNGDRFDIKKINTRFLYHNLGPVSPFKSIDTLKIVKNNFSITSNKLDFISKYLNGNGKFEHEGIELWKKCMKGDKESFKIMQDYNIQDVKILEDVYLQVRSFDNRHPSIAMLTENKSFMCTKYGSKHIDYIKDVYTNTRTYKLYKCLDCGGYSRSRKSINNVSVLMTQ